MNALKLAIKKSIKDICVYLKFTPVDKRVQWLKDGEKWIKEIKKTTIKQ